jgi:adenosine deaminase
MRTAADGIDVFREFLAESDDLSVAFLAGINMTKTEAQLDALFDVLDAGGELTASIVGLDINFLSPDLPKFDRYLSTLRSLQSGGLKVNIHLGELFDNEISRYVLRRITPDRIGHGVLLLDDLELVEIVKSYGICLDMCPTSNIVLGVADWNRSSPASRALQLGIPVSINTDDPILFGTDISRELDLAGLSDQQRDQVIANGRRYRHGRI